MSIAEIGRAAFIVGSGVVAGKVCGATWVSASFFLVTDLAVWGFLIDSWKLNSTILPLSFSHSLVKFVVPQIISCSAGILLTRGLFSKGWKQAVPAHLATILAIVICVRFFPRSNLLEASHAG